MDSSLNISDCDYVTGITNSFMVPTALGGIPAVAVGIRNASLILSAYTLMTVSIFLVAWNLLVASIAVLSPDNPSASRYVSLVVIWNTNGPSSAAMMMLEHCRRVLLMQGVPLNRGVPFGENQEPRSNDSHGVACDQETNGGQASSEYPARSPGTRRKKVDVRNLWWGVLFFFLSYIMWIGHLSAGLLISSQLWMGYFAPVNPSSIFYPNQSALFWDVGMEGVEKFSLWKNPSTLRALGAVEGSSSTIMRRVHTKRLEPPDGQTASLWAGLSYSYNITGVDMGLQSDPKLTLMVEGSCHTDYTWLVNSTDEADIYRIWGGNGTFEVKRKEESNLPPMLAFFIDIERYFKQSLNMSYAMIIDTAGHYSRTQSQDPWYATENFQTNKTGRKLYQILPKRPVLSCWEAKRWHINGKEVEVSRLKELPGVNLHRFWMEEVFPYEFTVPTVAILGIVAGQSALKSTSFGSSLHSLHSFYVLDSGSSGVLDDLERLVRASWISGKNVLRDTTTYDPRDMENSARRPDGSVKPGIGEFVLESRDVGTLSVRLLTSIPIILISLLIARVSLATLIERKGLVTLPSIYDLIDNATKPKPGYNDNHRILMSSAQPSKH
ncbi:hypothetical protein HOY80DRAFT_894480 [Tuber brumale]|nr:hypothetical protein HOY80DRAFT_894480 [Tuber brumale]